MDIGGYLDYPLHVGAAKLLPLNGEWITTFVRRTFWGQLGHTRDIQEHPMDIGGYLYYPLHVGAAKLLPLNGATTSVGETGSRRGRETRLKITMMNYCWSS